MISLIYPINNSIDGRLELFKNTITSIMSYANDITDKFEMLVLDSQCADEVKEYIISVKDKFDITYIGYEHPHANRIKRQHSGVYAWNLGVTQSKYNSVVLTSPEVRHETPVIKQLLKLIGQNILCKVGELDQNGDFLHWAMGPEHHRADNPGFFFIGMYNKEDYLSIGGLDEKMMEGLGYEDTDFGRRFKLMFDHTDKKHKTVGHIVGQHQYHPRLIPTSDNLFRKNGAYMQKEKDLGTPIANVGNTLGDPKYIVTRV